jgi:hypothetical protein
LKDLGISEKEPSAGGRSARKTAFQLPTCLRSWVWQWMSGEDRPKRGRLKITKCTVLQKCNSPSGVRSLGMTGYEPVVPYEAGGGPCRSHPVASGGHPPLAQKLGQPVGVENATVRRITDLCMQNDGYTLGIRGRSSPP